MIKLASVRGIKTRTRFKMLIEAQLDMLNTDDWDHLLEYEVDATELKVHEEEDSLA